MQIKEGSWFRIKKRFFTLGREGGICDVVPSEDAKPCGRPVFHVFTATDGKKIKVCEECLNLYFEFPGQGLSG